MNNKSMNNSQNGTNSTKDARTQNGMQSAKDSRTQNGTQNTKQNCRDCKDTKSSQTMR